MSESSTPPASPPVQDTSALSWLLVIVGMANLIGFTQVMMTREDILATRPDFSPRLLTAATGAALVNIVSIVGLLRWRRWGVVGLTTGLVALLIANVIGGSPFEFTLLAPIALLLVGIYLWPVRERLR